MDDLIYKTCSGCKESKQLVNFYRNNNAKDGFHTRCKSCHRNTVLKWNEKNPGGQAENVAKWRKNNPEKNKAIGNRYYNKNSEKIKVNSRKWIKEHPEKEIEYSNKVRKKNPTKHRERVAQYNKNNPEKGILRTLKKVNEISDSYISSIICKGSKLKRSDIPLDFIELKRELIMLHREIKIHKT